MEWNVSLEELPGFAPTFWSTVKDATLFAFHGNMGAGKTTFITAVCQYKGVTDTMGSPTFSIVNEYSYSENGEEKVIYHIDLYRLNSEEEVVRAGIEDCLYSGAICMVEWPEKAPHLFDNSTVKVYLETLDSDTRRVKIILPAISLKEQS